MTTRVPVPWQVDVVLRMERSNLTASHETVLSKRTHSRGIRLEAVVRHLGYHGSATPAETIDRAQGERKPSLKKLNGMPPSTLPLWLARHEVEDTHSPPGLGAAWLPRYLEAFSIGRFHRTASR